MINESIIENLHIHNDNLSVYYLGSVFITVISVFITWWYSKYCAAKTSSFDVICRPSDKEDECQGDIPVDQGSKDESFIDQNHTSHIKTARHILAEEVAANLTAQQLEEEKEVEKQQLEAIFQLLQVQQDKYQMSSMEELEDQLRLYR